MRRRHQTLIAAILTTVAIANAATASPTRAALKLSGRTPTELAYSATVPARDAAEPVQAVDLLIHATEGCRDKTYDVTIAHEADDSRKTEITARLRIADTGNQWVALDLPSPGSPAGRWSVTIHGPAPRPTATSLYLLPPEDGPAEETLANETATTPVVVVRPQASDENADTTRVMTVAPTRVVAPHRTPVVVRPIKVTRAYRGHRYWRYHARPAPPHKTVKTHAPRNHHAAKRSHAVKHRNTRPKRAANSRRAPRRRR